MKKPPRAVAVPQPLDVEAAASRSPRKEHRGTVHLFTNGVAVKTWPTALPPALAAFTAAIKPWHCQAALATTQTLFVVGSVWAKMRHGRTNHPPSQVYLKRCLQVVDATKAGAFHPIIYAFLREAVAGPILWLLSYAITGARCVHTIWLTRHPPGKLLPAKPDYLQVTLLGAFLYLNQLFFILGIALSGVVVATCIQPVIPVLTAAMAVSMGMESGSLQKFVGIGLAVGGSVAMVLGGISTASHHSAAESRNLLTGNLCLMANTVSMSLYYLNAKKLVQRYSPAAVTAWAYITAASLMGATAAGTISIEQWTVPRPLLGPLLYWIVICSVIGYFVVTAATQYLPASQVLLLLDGVCVHM